MTSSGKVRAARYQKFRQINRFLELVDDVLDELPAEGTLNIVDFGSGNLIQGNIADADNNGSGNGGGIWNSATITGSPNYGSGNTPNNCAGVAVPGIFPDP